MPIKLKPLTPIVTSNNVAPSNINVARALPNTPVVNTPKVTSGNVSPTTIPVPKTVQATPQTNANQAVTQKDQKKQSQPQQKTIVPTTNTAPSAATPTQQPTVAAAEPQEKKPKGKTVVPDTSAVVAAAEPLVNAQDANQTDANSEAMAAMQKYFQDQYDTLNQQYQSLLGSKSQQQSDIINQINALNQAKQAQAIANLDKARNTQLSNLASEQAGIKPLYYDKRNSAAATNMMGRRTLSEELAARGEAKSGVADQANINANMSLQGNIGALNRQETADFTDIARRTTDVQNAYESDVASAKAGLDAAAMQSVIDQLNADRTFKLQESGVTGTYNGTQTLAAQNQTFNQNLATEQFNQAKTQQEIDNIFRQTQADINNKLTNRQITNAEAQQALDNLYREKTLAEQQRQFNVTFDYQKQRDAVSDTQWQQTMNLNLRQQTFNEAQAAIDNALAQKRISQQDASQALQWAQFNAEQDPNSLDNQLKRAQLNSSSSNTDTTSTVDDFASTINSLYVASPSSSNNYTASIDTAGITAYLDKLMAAGVDDAIVDSLAARYGIQ